MLPVSLLVLAAFAVVVGAVWYGWRTGSLHLTEQEVVDLEFERIVAALD